MQLLVRDGVPFIIYDKDNNLIGERVFIAALIMGLAIGINYSGAITIPVGATKAVEYCVIFNQI